MPCTDRTREFLSIVGSMAREGKSEETPLLRRRPPHASGFSRTTARISADIYDTTRKLDKLAELAQSRSLFDDPTNEINELTYVIKQSIGAINAQLNEAQGAMEAYKRQEGSRGQQRASHATNTYDILRSQLCSATKGFASVLQTRSQNIKLQEERRAQMSCASSQPGSGDRSAVAPPNGTFGGPSSALLSEPLFTAPKAGDDDEPADTVIEIGTGGGALGAQAQEMMPVDLLETRANAIESVQHTLVELGAIFRQLQNIVAEQQIAVMTVHDDTERAVSNVESGQLQLMRYYRYVSSNRPLVFKCGHIPPHCQANRGASDTIRPPSQARIYGGLFPHALWPVCSLT